MLRGVETESGYACNRNEAVGMALATCGRMARQQNQSMGSEDALEMLEKQHRQVESLFEAFENAEDGRAKRSVFQRLADLLAIHSAIEEHHLYPAVKAEQTEELLLEAVEEHLSAKRIIADLLAMSASDENFEAKVKVLKEQVEHHVEEEEGELFPQVREMFSEEALGKIGAAMAEEAHSLEGHHPRDQVLSETRKAASIG